MPSPYRRSNGTSPEDDRQTKEKIHLQRSRWANRNSPSCSITFCLIQHGSISIEYSGVVQSSAGKDSNLVPVLPVSRRTLPILVGSIDRTVYDIYIYKYINIRKIKGQRSKYRHNFYWSIGDYCIGFRSSHQSRAHVVTVFPPGSQ